MSEDRIRVLLDKYLQRKCEKEEQAELFRLLNDVDPQQLDELLNDTWSAYESDRELPEEDTQQILASILVKRRASLLIGVFAITYLLLTSRKPDAIDRNVHTNIRPGSNQAELTMANGKKILLGNGSQEINIPNTGLIIQQHANGSLTYTKGIAGNKDKIAYDTLRTPKGGVYQLNLGDGTRIWLNTASAVRFPEKFASNRRDVELLYGEAYFEVKHRADAPFTVKTFAGIVRDLGTHFNVSSMAGADRVAATLLEGAMEVETNGQVKRIKPGQQALFDKKKLSVIAVDADQMIAWKEGYFMFDESMESAMQKIALWYDIKVEYQDEAIKTIPVLATITRDSNISKVLRILEMTKKVKFKLEGRSIKVARFK